MIYYLSLYYLEVIMIPRNNARGRGQQYREESQCVLQIDELRQRIAERREKALQSFNQEIDNIDSKIISIRRRNGQTKRQSKPTQNRSLPPSQLASRQMLDRQIGHRAQMSQECKEYFNYLQAQIDEIKRRQQAFETMCGQRFDRIEGRLDRLQQKFEVLSDKIDRIQSILLNSRIEARRPAQERKVEKRESIYDSPYSFNQGSSRKKQTASKPQEFSSPKESILLSGYNSEARMNSHHIQEFNK